MYRMLWLVLLAQLAQAQTPNAIPGKVSLRSYVPAVAGTPPRADVPPESHIGRIDTIGGTTYDAAGSGGPKQTLYCDTAWGLHAIWTFSTDLGSSYLDLNMRYNFLPKGDSIWRFNSGATFMDYGYNVFTSRSSPGMIDVNPNGGAEYFIATCTSPSSIFYPVVARDEAGPGQGGFGECTGEPNMDSHLGPMMGITASGRVHTASMCDSGGPSFRMDYSKVDPWCTWSPPFDFPPPGPEPSYWYIVAASKISRRVAIAWVATPESGPCRVYYKRSTDDGATWSDTISIRPPRIYEAPPDTASMFSETGIYPYFDLDDSLHVVATVLKSVQESSVSNSEAALADWSEELGWRVISMAKSDTAVSHGGAFSEPYADQVTVALTAPGTFVAVWQQFDAHNVDTVTGESRSDIYASVSIDRGVSWSEAKAAAHGGTVSRRGPFVARNTYRDSFDIIYLQDSQAGPSVPPYSLGTPTLNAYVVQRVPISGLLGVAARATAHPGSYLCRASPTVFRVRTTISYALPQAGKIDLRIYDAVGRPVRTLVCTRANPGRYAVTWDGLTNRNVPASPGVYFCALSAGKTSVTEKLTLLP